MKVFPWHLQQWQMLVANREKLPHALLLAGPAGVGKWHFAQILAAHLLCEQRHPATAACGSCSSCVWLAAGNHPDFRLIQPSAPETEGLPEEGVVTTSPPSRSATDSIRIGQIRALEDFVFLGSHRHGNRVVVLAPAEAINIAAANSILKLLEEPPARVYFILVSSQPRRLLPTILSRCQRLTLGRPEKSVARAWLEQEGVGEAEELLDLAVDAPLIAAEWAARGSLQLYRKAIAILLASPGNPVAMAADWGALVRNAEGLSLSELVNIMQKWLFDLVSMKLAGVCRYHCAWRSKLERLATQAHTANLLACYNDMLRIKAVVTHPLNSQLFLEDMAARYLRALAPKT